MDFAAKQNSMTTNKNEDMNKSDSSALENIWVAEVCNAFNEPPEYFYALLSGFDEVSVNGLAEVVCDALMCLRSNESTQWIANRLRKDFPETLDPSQEYFSEILVGLDRITIELRPFTVDKSIEEYDIDLSTYPTKPIHRGDTAYVFVDGRVIYGVYSVPVDDDETICLPLKVY